MAAGIATDDPNILVLHSDSILTQSSVSPSNLAIPDVLVNSTLTVTDTEIIDLSRITTIIPLTSKIDSFTDSGPLFSDLRMRNVSTALLLVILGTLAREGKPLKYQTKPPSHAFSLSFADEPEYNSFAFPKQFPRSPKYSAASKYPEFFGSTPASSPVYLKSVKPGRGSSRPPVYHGRAPSFCDPHNPPACASNGSYYCMHDSYYPTHDVELAIGDDPHLVQKYADVSEQSADDLVTQIAASQEAEFDYSYYIPAVYDITHWIGPEGYLCPSKVIYGTPKRARNVKGEWRVIVNGIRYYTQTARIETCLFPLTPCRMLAPCFKSKCIQKFIYHRMLSYDPCDPYKGLFVDIYKLPSACSCFVAAMHE
ncbi:uncharacterized protein LOC135218768 [Macrobrachium nipponense]|uniref:uncharacterized protein LOC135218768 n=1 Tax=Macrobrachium nipponense TaxID=159736 RepID=UPI0030C7C22C